MKKRGKKYLEALNKIEKGKTYTKEEAVKLAKETSVSKFNASVEVAVRLNLDTKKADQQLRGALVLPNGTGKTKRVLVIAKGAKETVATITRDQLREIAEIKLPDLNAYTVEEAMKTVEGTALNMGVKVSE